MLKTFNASEQKPYESVDLSPNSKVRNNNTHLFVLKQVGFANALAIAIVLIMKLLAASRGHDILFVSTADGKELLVIPNALEDEIKRIVFSPSGDEVLVVGKKCKHVKVFKAPKQ